MLAHTVWTDSLVKENNQLLAGLEGLGLVKHKNLNCSHLEGYLLWSQQGSTLELHYSQTGLFLL